MGISCGDVYECSDRSYGIVRHVLILLECRRAVSLSGPQRHRFTNTNSRITFTLLAGSQYFILANSFDPNVFGDYALKVTAVAGFVAQSPLVGKPGKASISSLLKSLRRP
jgi:hypothetical protein